MAKNGIILLDKASGLTSREVDNKIMRLFSSKKVGHLGTLDPFATGLLVIAINKGTKYLPFLDSSKKSYIASLILGKKTSSGDPETPIIEERDPPSLDEKAIKSVLDSFLGDSLQLPPMTSAIKKDGVELYKLAHEGKEIEREQRKIHIYSINLISYKDGVIVFTCTVSEGTYIRTLGEDIAKKLMTIGYLSSLRRLSVGPFMISMASPLEKISEASVFDPSVFITSMKHVEIEESDEAKVKNGVPMSLKEDYGEKVILSLHGEALAVYERTHDSVYRSFRGLF